MKVISAFLKGLACLINPPTYHRRRFRKNSASAIRESLKSDWKAIGRDFRKVMDYGSKQ